MILYLYLKHSHNRNQIRTLLMAPLFLSLSHSQVYVFPNNDDNRGSSATRTCNRETKRITRRICQTISISLNNLQFKRTRLVPESVGSLESSQFE